MAIDCRQIVEDYVKTLDGSFEVHPTESGCMIVTPFPRRDNDMVEIGVEPQPDGRILLTDYGETAAYLALSGVNVSRSAELKRVLSQASRRFSVEASEADISVYTSEGNLGSDLQNLIGAVSDIAYLVYKRRRRPPLRFDEKVEKALIADGFGYESSYPITGKTETHRFRFYVNGTYRSLVEPVTATSVTAALAKAERLAFRWLDIRDAGDYNKIAVLNDEGDHRALWNGRPMEVLSGYSDAVVLWTAAVELATHIRRSRLL